MATTAKGTPYVESSDLVANYPAVSLALAEHIDDFGGKVLQVVRATDATDRSTTSTSFVDASLSVTITPQRSNSTILLIHSSSLASPNNSFINLRITDASNNPISGAETRTFGVATNVAARSTGIVIGYASPATTSPVTYKVRFSVSLGTGIIENVQSTGQLFAIEVSA
jgi:hypothetical protein